MQRVLSVAEIDSVEIGGDCALDDREIVGVPLSGLRTPRPGSVRVVIIFGQGGQKLSDDLNVHYRAPCVRSRPSR